MTTPPTTASRPKRRRKERTTNPPNSPAPPRAELGRVVLAVVVGAHGIGGEVKLKVFAEDLSAYHVVNDGRLTITALRTANQGSIARFVEITTREAAEALRGTELYVARATLPPLGEGEYYHADLLGLPVISEHEAPVGRVVLIENFGAGDVLEIERPDGRRFMVPMRAEAVPEWNAERLIVSAEWIDG